jgi:hypothetical protein
LTIINNDAESIFTALSAAYPPNYQPMDMYRDFRAVFLGSDQGKRVLFEILKRGHYDGPLIPKTPEIDPLRMAMGEGARQLVLGVLETMNTEPPAQRPTRTNSERGTI